ncbi:hypothetical protein [Aquimarina algicola]|uniref:Uncharacterized protein n=1 Tax=Aquimarina algicola TaxID=2589995 RepID=A0A504JAE0_9FLAO|nr:hypothetical protein [Aquimarina algicola]TPN84513.1 hypothetical protein FHK87_16405 [Aquimarina algicola]
MSNNELQREQERHIYLQFIVQRLHMSMEDFMDCVVVEDRCYEKMIYKWVYQLFDKNIQKDKALQIIYRIRMRMLFQTQNEL